MGGRDHLHGDDVPAVAADLDPDRPDTLSLPSVQEQLLDTQLYFSGSTI